MYIHTLTCMHTPLLHTSQVQTCHTHTPLKLGNLRRTLATTHVSCRVIQNSTKAPSKAFKPPHSHCHSLVGRSGVHQRRLACNHNAGLAYQAVGSCHSGDMLCSSDSGESTCLAYQATRQPLCLTRQSVATAYCPALPIGQ